MDCMRQMRLRQERQHSMRRTHQSPGRIAAGQRVALQQVCQEAGRLFPLLLVQECRGIL